MSNGKLLTVKHIVRNGSLWGSNFSVKYFYWQASESTQLPVTRFFFLPLLSRTLNDQLSSNFHRFVILCVCWDTPSEKTVLWQLPKVSSAFKRDGFQHLLVDPLINYSDWQRSQSHFVLHDYIRMKSTHSYLHSSCLHFGKEMVQKEGAAINKDAMAFLGIAEVIQVYCLVLGIYRQIYPNLIVM